MVCESEFYMEDSYPTFVSENKENLKYKRAMAIVDENIRGRIGNSVFYRVGPATRVRSVTSSYTDANTTRQQESRSRLRVAVRFYQRLVEVELQKPWFLVAQGSGKSGYNLFMKLNMMVFKPNGRIGDFARLQLTIGRLQKANHLVACVGEQDMVSLTWERGESLPSAGEGDELVVVVLYADRSFSPEFVKTNGETRGDGKATFRLPGRRGTAVHLYCFFRKKNGEAYSPSQYLGIS